MLGRITRRGGVRTVHGVRWPAKNHINHPHIFLRNYSQKRLVIFRPVIYLLNHGQGRIQLIFNVLLFRECVTPFVPENCRVRCTNKGGGDASRNFRS